MYTLTPVSVDSRFDRLEPAPQPEEKAAFNIQYSTSLDSDLKHVGRGS